MQTPGAARLRPCACEIDDELRWACRHVVVARSRKVVFDKPVFLREQPGRDNLPPGFDNAKVQTVAKTCAEIDEVLARQAPEWRRLQAVHRLLARVDACLE